jgi:hypothetical protein
LVYKGTEGSVLANLSKFTQFTTWFIIFYKKMSRDLFENTLRRLWDPEAWGRDQAWSDRKVRYALIGADHSFDQFLAERQHCKFTDIMFL